MPKEAALTSAAKLVDVLRAEQHAGKAAAVEEAEQLERAIQASHPEGIRFRAYTLQRMLAQEHSPFSNAARQAFEDLRYLITST